MYEKTSLGAFIFANKNLLKNCVVVKEEDGALFCPKCF